MAKKSPPPGQPAPQAVPVTLDELRERVVMASAHVDNAVQAFDRGAAMRVETQDDRIVRREVTSAAIHIKTAVEIARALSRRRPRGSRS